MINKKLNIKKSFREQVQKCMNNTFGPRNKPFIETTLAKNNTRVLVILMFYEIRKNPKKSVKMLSCVIYTIISNYVCIDYIACVCFFKSELPLGTGGGFTHENKSYDKIFGIAIPYLFMNLISCHGFLKNKNSVFIKKFPKRMLEYHF